MIRKYPHRKKKRKASKKDEENVQDLICNDESDFQDLEASDFDLSADELEDNFKEKYSTSLLDIVTDNLDKDCSDASECEEDDNNNSTDEKKKELQEDQMDKLEIAASDSERNTPNIERKASVGG